MSENEIILRYGFNPHQKPARIYCQKRQAAFQGAQRRAGVYQYAGCS